MHPVTFVNSPEEECFKSVVEHDPLVLECEVSRADAPVQWYVDGVELQACDNVTMTAADTARTLSIRRARLSDAATYTCRAGDSALIFKVNVRGNVCGGRDIVYLCEFIRNMVDWLIGQSKRPSFQISLKMSLFIFRATFMFSATLTLY